MGRAVSMSYLCLLALCSFVLIAHHTTASGTSRVVGKNASRHPKPPPCTTAQNITIPVYTIADIHRRTTYPSTSVVTLVLQNNLVVPGAILMDSKFKCTLFKSANFRKYTISTTNLSEPIVKLVNVSNVLFYGVNFNMPNQDMVLINCTYPGIKDYIGAIRFCPAIFIYNTFAVQVTQANIFGKIEIWRSIYTRIDNINATCNRAVAFNPAEVYSVVRVSLCGDGPNLMKANIFITNNYFEGSWNGSAGVTTSVMVTRGAVGVIIRNNHVHNFIRQSVQLGHDVGNVGDAMLNTVAYNEITHDFGYLDNYGRQGFGGDNTGIYLDLHWVNPGNYFRCNYVRGGGHCFYNDYASSGTVVDGLVCDKTRDGIKLNNGKTNQFTGVILIGITSQTGYITCQDPVTNSCNGAVGSIWASKLYSNYQTPAIKRLFPWMSTICNVTSINRVSCLQGVTNSSYLAAGCSGLPTNNYVEAVRVDERVNAPTFGYDNRTCSYFPAVDNFNIGKTYLVTNQQARFNDPTTGDYGIRASRKSIIKKYFPNFRSCPLKFVGPKPMKFQDYQNLFNVHRPRVIPFNGTLYNNPFSAPYKKTYETN